MQNFNFLLFFLIFFTILLVSSCKNRVIDQLRPETVTFLSNQEKARCACLDTYGKEFLKKTNNGISYINSLEATYNLDSLSLSELYEIKLQLVSFMSIVKTVSNCVAQKTPPIDQFTGMLMQEDLKVVLEIDSTMSEQEQLERMNVPSLELLDEYCPQHKEAVLKLQELIHAAQILPPGLQ
ncbi:hypothetical protein [Aureispira anguillae]|uniref:Uncharacterized protein n=1 Tax=Aureispira anguillae TaxID=2864201 RepID=A0A916DVN4_9BACT|nr:hypothetical protein [Aureispira anguillae]BDS13750.1 hypothetical protein AsAng_0044910 [Aureispira anguillae]